MEQNVNLFFLCRISVKQCFHLSMLSRGWDLGKRVDLGGGDWGGEEERRRNERSSEQPCERVLVSKGAGESGGEVGSSQCFQQLRDMSGTSSTEY